MSEGNPNKFWLDRIREHGWDADEISTLNLIGARHQAEREGDTEHQRILEAELAKREELGTY